MAVSKVVTGTSMTIEVQKGLDKAGAPVWSKKSFSNLRNDVDLQNAYDVAEAIKGVLETNTKEVALVVTADLVSA
jgi:hypothetical protein